MFSQNYSLESTIKKSIDGFEIPELNRKKAVLQSLRDLHQPLNFREIEQEQKEKEKLVKEKVAKLKREREEEMRERVKAYDPGRFKNKWSQEADEERIIKEQ